MEDKNTIDKCLLDKAIDLCQRYYRESSNETFNLYNKAEYEAFGDKSLWLNLIISGITCKRLFTYDEPHETYYKVLECLGLKII